MGTESLTYLRLNLWDWIRGTIEKIQHEPYAKEEWNKAWVKTYKELGGKSQESGKKGCPKKAAYCLFMMGKIKGSNKPFERLTYQDIQNKYGKNGVYAIMAINILKDDQSLNLNSLWKKVQDKYIEEIGEKPAKSDQGAVTVAFKLFNNRKIISKQYNPIRKKLLHLTASLTKESLKLS